MKKHQRMQAFVAGLETDASLALDPCYQGYFRCFNAGLYYEAHDVLEHLWLANGRADANFAFYKGLIQVAGAFVHLKKQAARPGHPKDGRRLRPATRLFGLAIANLAEYGPVHLALDVDALCALCTGCMAAIVESDFTRNPWSAENAPRLALELLP
jgi:predicted metal-dependent hydrolase